MGASDYVTAREAIALLAVRLPTLYAYVSRGLVRSVPGPSKRGRLYLRADLERLKARAGARAGHEAVAVDALRWGQPVLDSALTRIDDRGPAYRGREATALATDDVQFEWVAELLWDDAHDAPGAQRDLPTSETWQVPELGYRPDRLATRDGRAKYFHRLMLVLPLIAAEDPDVGPHASAEDERRRARALLVRLRAALAGDEEATAEAALAAPSMARGVGIALGARDPERAERAINRCLVLCADHELNASAFAARIAASAGCNLYGCVAAALAVLSGDRHGGATASIEAAVNAVGSASRASRFVGDRRRSGQGMPGFGHPLYPNGDPRATVLLETARDQGPAREGLLALFAMVDAMRDSGKEWPTLDVGLFAVAQSLDLPPGAAGAVFAIGRAAGWVAHALEQRTSGAFLRPRARYVGPP